MSNRIQIGPFRPVNSAYIPTRKVGASALAGALSILVVWVLNTFILADHTLITGEVASALTTVLTFLVGYFFPG
jgi:hypothetical protein